jgi:hypothetical protein
MSCILVGVHNEIPASPLWAYATIYHL